MDIRDEIARLSAEHDKLMREDAQWMAKREAAREALARKSEPDGLVYRTFDNNAQPSAAAAPVPSDAEPYPSYDVLRQAVAAFVVTWCDEKLAPRDERITKLEGKVDTLIGLLGQKSFSHDGKTESTVVELPRGRHPHNVPARRSGCPRHQDAGPACPRRSTNPKGLRSRLGVGHQGLYRCPQS